MLVHRYWIAGLAGLAYFAVPAQAATIMDFPNNAALQGRAELQAYAFLRSAPPIARQCNGQAGRGSFTVTKPVDEMTSQLTEAAQSKKGSMVQIDDMRADGTRVAFQFTDATISKIEPASGGDRPMESISFNYSKVQWVTVGCKATAPARRNNAVPSGPSYGGYGGYN